MSLGESLRTAMATTIGKTGKYTVVSGVATNVTDHHCDLERDGEATLLDVKLHVVDDAIGNRFVIKPKAGSMVVCAFIQDQQPEACIIQYSEIDEVIMQVGDKQYRLSSSGHRIAGGDDTLRMALVLVIDAVQEIIVLQGRNPNRAKLMQAKSIIQSILQ